MLIFALRTRNRNPGIDQRATFPYQIVSLKKNINKRALLSSPRSVSAVILTSWSGLGVSHKWVIHSFFVNVIIILSCDLYSFSDDVAAKAGLMLIHINTDVSEV